MMNNLNWRRVKLGEISEILIGGTPSRKKEEYWDKDLKTDNLWVSISDLQSKYIQDTKERITDEGIRNSNVKLLPENTVIMSFKLTVGRTAITKKPMYTNEAIAGFLPKEQNMFSNEYLYYALSNLDFEDSLDVAVKGQTLNKAKLQNLTIMLPSIVEQRKIAAILSSVDEAIEKTEAIIEQTEKVKKGLMQQLLTKGIGHTKFKKTEIGEIPEEWEVKKFKDITTVLKCGVASTPTYVDEGIPFLSAQNVKEGKILLENYRFISQEYHRELTKKVKPQKGDILYTRVGANIGNAAVVDFDMEFSVYVSLTLIRMIEGLNSYFYAYLLNSPLYRKRANMSQYAGAGVPNLNVKVVEEFPMVVPPLEEQNKIVNIFQNIDSKIEKEKMKLLTLQHIKIGLMQVLLTGKVRVKVDDEVMSQ